MVSNSLAVWAKSSSRAGTSFSFTDVTVTWNVAVVPACTPYWISAVKSRSSPAPAPVTASSMPVMSESLPTSYDSPLASEPSTALPSGSVARMSMTT